MNLVQILSDLFQKVPAKARGYVYLVVVVAGVAYIAVSAVRSGYTPEQIVALVLTLVGGLAKSNVSKPARKTRPTLED